MSRSRAWRRWKNYTKARRKRELDKELTALWYHDGELVQRLYYPFLNQYNKGKIHCSCPMCRNKTNNKGAAALYNGVHNPTLMDKRREDAMDADEFDFLRNDIPEQSSGLDVRL